MCLSINDAYELTRGLVDDEKYQRYYEKNFNVLLQDLMATPEVIRDAFEYVAYKHPDLIKAAFSEKCVLSVYQSIFEKALNYINNEVDTYLEATYEGGS